MRARLLPAVLAVAAVASAAVAVAPRPGATARVADEPAADPVTPVFSLRRVPDAVTRSVAAARLRSDIDAVLALPAFATARDDTCLVVSDPAGRSLYALDPARSLIPASAMKLVTATVALARLGADARYVTPVRASAPPQDGTVADLWLVGAGDPLLATADYAAVAGWLDTPKPATAIETLADRVVAAGVRRVGRVLGDESRYDTQRYVPTWEPSYATAPHVGPQSALTVNGGFVRWRPQPVPAAAPATHGATVLADLLRARGVAVGDVGEGPAPEGAVTLAQIESPPLTELVGTLIRDSDNLAAELLVKELGVRFAGAGTTAAGLDVVRSTAAELGLDLDAFAAADGSGLDRSDRLSCSLLQEVLARSGDRHALARAMPVSGSSGTLLRRFLGTPAEGRVRAKTGSLAGVVALTGWAEGGGGAALAFSMLANDVPSEPTGMALQDRLANVLVTYPEAPPADEVGPQPPRARPG